MSSEHTISVATANQGRSERGSTGSVSIPVRELMTSNGVVTGQSGADPTASVRRIAESLLDAGQTLCVVDPGGDFDPVTDHSSVLHVGGDRNCDVQIHAGSVDRVASLALDGSTSIVLSLDGFEAGPADDLLGGLTDALVNARQDRRGDLLLLVNECHRWLAANGPATRSGENLLELGGRRHADVGILGVTDQPADVREDVLTGVDWLLAHRLTWREDVRALERLMDRQYTNALESLDDREAFFNAGWERGVRRISFEPAGRLPDDSSRERREPNARSQRRDAHESPGTPGDQAGDDDLLAGVPEARAPADVGEEMERMRADLADIEDRLGGIEAELDAREDTEAMADRIADTVTAALEDGRLVQSPEDRTSTADRGATNSTDGWSASPDESRDPPEDSGMDGNETDGNDEASADDGPGGFGDVFGMFDDSDTTDTDDSGSVESSSPETATNGHSTTASDSRNPSSANDSSGTTGSGNEGTTDSSGGGMSFEPIDFGFDDPAQNLDSTVPDDFGPPARHGTSGRSIPRYLRKIVRAIEEMDETTRRMLAHYVEEGTESPMDAHFAACGGGDRTRAYAHNRQLRTNGLIEHVGKGKYAPRLREYVVDRAGHSVPEHELDRAEDVIRQTVEAA